MEKIKNYFLRFYWALIAPAIFLGVVVTTHHSPITALIGGFSVMLIQIILRFKFEGSFEWNEYEDISFDGESYFNHNKAFNIGFNITRVAAIAWVLLIIFREYLTILRPFGEIEVEVAIFLIAIISLLSLKRFLRLQPYEKIRFIFSLLISMMLLVSCYLFFGTQLVWLPFGLFALFGVNGGFRELDDVFRTLRRIDIKFSCLFLVLGSLLIAIISTIVQFWNSMSALTISFWSHVLSIGIYELIPGLEIWLIIIGLFVITISAFFIIKFIKRRLAEKRSKLAIKEAECSKKKAEAEKANYIKEAKAKIAEIIEESLKSKSIIKHELDYLVDKNLRPYLPVIDLEFLKLIKWEQYITISQVKKQIVWEHSMKSVISFLDYIYSKTYSDKELSSILLILIDLREYFLNPDYSNFRGVADFKKMFESETLNIPVEFFSD